MFAARFDAVATDGIITQEQLKLLLVQLNNGAPVSEEESAAVFKRADKNKSGTIDRCALAHPDAPPFI